MRRPEVSRGRPKKEGEVLSEERAIKFTPSMMKALQALNAKTGVSIAEIVRRAVEKDLDDHNAPPDRVCLEILPSDQENLKALADDLGMPKVEYLLAHMARRAVITNRKELLHFLYGGFFDGEDEAVEADRKRQEQKRGNGKAA